MMKRILVPLDGSPRAERALPVAARLAHANQGSIVLLQVVRPPMNAADLFSPVASPSDRVNADVMRAARYLDQVAHFPILKDLPIEKQALVGSVADTILSLVEARSSDLIILCSHGEISTAGRAPGSIAEKLAHDASIPVLILHEGGPIPLGAYREGTQPLCALLPLDGSPRAEAVIEPAAEVMAALAAPARARLHLLHVVQGAGGRENQEHLSRLARLYLKATAEYIRREVVPGAKQLGLTITWSVTTEAQVTEAMLRTAETCLPGKGADTVGSCDLIAVTTHGLLHLPQRGLGNASRHLLHATRLPVLIVHPPDAAQETVEIDSMCARMLSSIR